MKNNLKVIAIYVLFIAVITVVIAGMFGQTQPEKLEYSDIVAYFTDEQVKTFKVDPSGNMTLTLRSKNAQGELLDTTFEREYKLDNVYSFREEMGELIEQQRKDGIISNFDYEAAPEYPWFLSFLPYIILAAVFIGFWIYMMRQATGQGGKIGAFGKARVKLGTAEKDKTKFSDVAGADEEKEELHEIVEFLKNPQNFTKLGAKIPHGVLLMGPPGTGKTLLAKAVAGEAGVPFYSISGSDFVEMYVGVGASRVRDLFDTAKKNPASIVFIDEIDAVGRQRGAGLGGGHDEREQTLNQLLVEMDGFDRNSGVIVMAATNRPDVLDPALLRPGRFDRQITVNYPDIKGREAILKVHSKGKPFEADVDMSVIAKTTVGFTGADLANLLNEAALLAARRRKHLIGMNDIEDAMIKIMVGPQKHSKVISEKEKKLTAYHEAGHAIAHKILSPDDRVHQISIIPSGMAGGYTLPLPKEDRSYRTRSDMQTEIETLLGGRVAEALVMGDISTGASNDIQRATNIARSMVTKYGMSDKLGPIVYGAGHGDSVFLGRDFSATPNYSETTATSIDDEVRRIVEDAYVTVEKVFKENMDKLDFVAQFLIKNETMDEEQFDAAMKEGATEEQLMALVSAKRKKSEEENAAAKKIYEDEEKRRAKEQTEGVYGDNFGEPVRMKDETEQTDDSADGTDESTDGTDDSTDGTDENADGADDSKNDDTDGKKL